MPLVMSLIVIRAGRTRVRVTDGEAGSRLHCNSALALAVEAVEALHLPLRL